jgi:hypothetical protein
MIREPYTTQGQDSAHLFLLHGVAVALVPGHWVASPDNSGEIVGAESGMLLRTTLLAGVVHPRSVGVSHFWPPVVAPVSGVLSRSPLEAGRLRFWG